jgi:mRNA-degrading endonuclease toxin of MazEF toxin-antitoxin module
MDPQQGELYWVDIPKDQTEGSEQSGRRPFVVMSRDGVNRRLKTVVVVPLTTYSDQINRAALASEPPYRIVIPPSEITKDPNCSSQISLSVAKTDQARVIDKSRLKQRIGRLIATDALRASDQDG